MYLLYNRILTVLFICIIILPDGAPIWEFWQPKFKISTHITGKK